MWSLFAAPKLLPHVTAAPVWGGEGTSPPPSPSSPFTCSRLSALSKMKKTCRRFQQNSKTVADLTATSSDLHALTAPSSPLPLLAEPPSPLVPAPGALVFPGKDILAAERRSGGEPVDGDSDGEEEEESGDVSFFILEKKKRRG